jgi:protein SCO1
MFPRQMSAAVAVMLVVLAIAALAVGAWLLSQGDERNARTIRTATVLPEPRALPEFELRDHNGAPFTRASLEGRTSVVFFGFTHCPDICPATLQQLAMARDRLAATAGHSDNNVPEIVLISVDPARDTPETLGRYVEYFGEGITGATASPEDLLVLTSALGIFFEPVPTGDGTNYTVNHSTAVLVIDPQARLQAIFSAPHSIEAFVQDLPLLIASR